MLCSGLVGGTNLLSFLSRTLTMTRVRSTLSPDMAPTVSLWVRFTSWSRGLTRLTTPVNGVEG